MAAVALGAAALVFRLLAAHYLDRTLEGVRTLRTANQQLENPAFHDPLTSLANRSLFAERHGALPLSCELAWHWPRYLAYT